MGFCVSDGSGGVIYRERYNAFWVFTKSKIHFEKRPTWRQKIDASTFPIDNAGFKTHVNTVLRDKDGFPEAAYNEPFEKFDSEFSEDDFKYEQVIRSQHIDMSHHMNNIEYIKLALNVFTDDFLLAHEPESLEVHYTGESKEGQTLRVYSRTKDSSTQIVIKESNRSVFEMKISFR